MKSDDIIAFWGYDNLKRWSESTLQGLTIPENSKNFLITVGLPIADVEWSFRFDFETFQRLPKESAYLCIGFDYQVPICLSKPRNGCVVWVDSAERFANANLELFAECLVYYQQYRQQVHDVDSIDEPKCQQLISATASKMMQADPLAFETSDNVWPTILQQMKHGLL